MSTRDTSLVEIDKDRLDTEWAGQAGLFYDHAMQLAEAKLNQASAKTNVDLVEADLSLKIRSNPDQYGLGKVTEAAIKDTVTTHPAYAKAVAEGYEARYETDVLQAAVDALEHRKRALESLVQLHGMSYFSQPKERKAVTREDVTAGKKSKKA